MVIELPKDLGPYSQMSSLSMFLHGAFPAACLRSLLEIPYIDHVIYTGCILHMLHHMFV